MPLPSLTTHAKTAPASAHRAQASRTTNAFGVQSQRIDTGIPKNQKPAVVSSRFPWGRLIPLLECDASPVTAHIASKVNLKRLAVTEVECSRVRLVKPPPQLPNGAAMTAQRTRQEAHAAMRVAAGLIHKGNRSRARMKKTRGRKKTSARAASELFKNADDDVLALAPKEVRDQHEASRQNELMENEAMEREDWGSQRMRW